MRLNVEKIRPTKKPGNYWVSAGGVDYFTKALGIEQMTGRSIEAEIGQFPGKNGPVKTIESFSPVAGAPESNGGGMPWWWPSVSNIWAHAIQSGHITPGTDVPVTRQLEHWALAVKTVALKLTQEEPDDPLE